MLKFDFFYLLEQIPKLVPYLDVTFLVLILTLFFGTSLGFVLASWKLGKNIILRKLADAFTTAMRCTPSIVLLFLVYYGLPAFAATFAFDLNDLSKTFFVVTAFSLSFGNVMAEIVRSSYLAVEKGQYEAAVSVGMTRFDAFRRIILPQAAVVALPNIINSVLTLLKEGSLAYTIGLIDVMGKANLLIAMNYEAHALETLLALAFIYWSISITIEKANELLEQRLSKGRTFLKTI
ncbi:MAG: amino acid ABC transporter permease [Acidaminococcaceae bacterium]